MSVQTICGSSDAHPPSFVLNRDPKKWVYENSPKVVLVNNFPPPTGIWKVAKLTHCAIKGEGELIMLRFGNFNYKTVDVNVCPTFGLSLKSNRVSSLLNHALYPMVFNRVRRGLAELSSRGTVIHYLSENVVPIHFGRKTLVTVHGNPMATIKSDKYYSSSNLHKVVTSFNLSRYGRQATAIAVSNYTMRGMLEYGYSGRVTVLYPAVDPIFGQRFDKGTLRRELGLPMDKYVVLSVSSAEKRKNLSILPKVMDILSNDYVLVRIGPPVRGARTFRQISDDMVAKIYSASDVLLFPTLEEGFGYPLVEGFSSGVPVVSSDIDVVREVSAGAAILTEPEDPWKLANSVREAVSNREELAKLGHDRSKHFTIEAFRKRLLAVYSQLPT